MTAFIITLLFIGVLTFTAKYMYDVGYDVAAMHYKEQLANARKRIEQLEDELNGEKSV